MSSGNSTVKTGDPAIPDIALPDGATLNIEAAVAPHCYALVPDVMDAAQMRFMHVPAYEDVATAMHFLGSLTDRSGAGRSWLLRVDASVVGWVSLFNVEHDMRELGYFVRARDGGRGIATAAARWATRHAHAELGVRRLHATTDPRNEVSRRVLNACGFVHEGTQRANFHYDNSWLDTALFGRLATDPLPTL